ncbi:uncharacterized protein METZ01_LOCUS165549 [marine metagenome]|uniref:Flagellin N-terminal domain-containing protein n=1 Tax=marine metagenome TaxID=408172 RepID=A0A382BFV8_9ZZZZ
MSINIKTNFGPTTKSLGDQGAFRNAMYHQDKDNKRENKIQVLKTPVKDQNTAQKIKNEKFRLLSAEIQGELTNVEEQMSIAQTAGKALIEVENTLIQINELLLIVNNETSCNSALMEADQHELEELIEQINKVADETSYRHKPLLDGSHGVRGVVNGEYLEFIDMLPDSKTSPLKGYEIYVTQQAKRSELCGQIPFSQLMFDNQELLTIEEGGNENRFVAKKGDSVDDTLNYLAHWISEREMPLEIVRNADNILHIRHLQYGSEYKFSASSSTAGVISSESKKLTPATPGCNVMGTINGIKCIGHGQFLTVPENQEDIGGLTVRYTGNEVPPECFAGIVSVVQNGFQFVTGSSNYQSNQLSLRNFHASYLGMETENVSGFKSLQDINVLSSQKVKDSINVLKKSLSEVTAVKDKIESVCYSIIKDEMRELQKKFGRKLFTSQIPDSEDNVQALAEQTKSKITEDTCKSSMAQAHQDQGNVLSLLK